MVVQREHVAINGQTQSKISVLYVKGHESQVQKVKVLCWIVHQIAADREFVAFLL